MTHIDSSDGVAVDRMAAAAILMFASHHDRTS